MTTRLYGHSDDCIEFECGKDQEEWGLGDSSHLHFPDGLVVRCTFDEANGEAWRFRVVKNPNGVTTVEKGPNEDMDYELHIEADYKSRQVKHYDGPDGPSVDLMTNVITNLFDGYRGVSQMTKEDLEVVFHIAEKYM